MKVYGKVKSYDKYNGIIKGTDGINYILNYKDIELKSNEELKKGDYVEFIPENYNTIESNLFIARSIKKLTKESILNEYPKTKGIK